MDCSYHLYRKKKIRNEIKCMSIYFLNEVNKDHNDHLSARYKNRRAFSMFVEISCTASKQPQHSSLDHCLPFSIVCKSFKIFGLREIFKEAQFQSGSSCLLYQDTNLKMGPLNPNNWSHIEGISSEFQYILHILYLSYHNSNSWCFVVFS